MRTLKFHEKKLLKKVNFFNWRPESDREISIVRRYHINSREDYIKYNKLCGYVTKLVACLAKLEPTDTFRIELTELVLSKLFDMGLINHKKSLKSCDKLSVSKFCRRRLPVVMVRLRLAKSVKEATEYIE
jgi:U3 small nucleolar ribonucleoprotein protein IMP3